MTVEAKLRITPQLEAAVAGLRGLLGQVRSLETGVQQADARNNFKTTQSGIDGVTAKLRQAHAQLLAFFGLQAGAQGLSALARMSDEYQGLNARLRIVTSGQQEFNTALATAKGLAAQYNGPLNETAALYTRILSAVRPLGGGTREASVATEALLASLKISGAAAAESGSAILQFSQALGSGVLRGEEFNAINEAAPRLLDALAAGLGKPRSELKALAEQGQLTTSAVVKALQAELPKLRAEAAQIPATISGAAQQVRDALAQFLGAEAQGSARVVVGLLKQIADNIGLIAQALSLVGAALTAAAIGRAVSALVAMAAAVGGVTTVTGVLMGALRGLLALVGGPVGLIIALASLAAAWVGLGNAKQGATARTGDQMRQERQDVLAEIERLKKGGSPATYYSDMVEARAKLRRLDDELLAAGQKATADNYGSRYNPAIELADPAAIKKFQDEYKLRADIVKKYAEERATFITAKDKEIAAAQKAGDTANVTKLTRDKSAYLKEQTRAEREALKTYDTRDATTRLAQAKVLYNKDFELLADATQREKALLQEKFDQGLVDLQAYLAQKARLQNAESNQEVDRLIGKLAEEERVLAENQKRAKAAKDPNAQDQAREAILASQQKIAELEVNIEQKERERINNARLLTEEAQRLTTELREQQKAVEAQVKQALGRESTADIQRRVQDQFAPQLAREFQLGGDGQGTQRLIDITVLREALAQMERDYARVLASIRSQEETLRLQQEQGAFTQEELERRILKLRQDQVPALQAQADEITRIASRLGADEQLRARDAGNSLLQLSDKRTQFDKEAESAGRSGLGQFFSDILTGSKTAGDALSSMLNNFKNQMFNLISQRLANKLFESFGLKGAIDSGVSAITSFFGFHEGGVVSAAGATFRRDINISPLAAALAPRYHTGGIAGLKPRERMAVLEDGEEVLTADDPRHVRNYRSAGGLQVSSSVTVNGASGDGAQQANAGADLNRVIEQAVDQWALKQSRPGGVLAGGR